MAHLSLRWISPFSQRKPIEELDCQINRSQSKSIKVIEFDYRINRTDWSKQSKSIEFLHFFFGLIRLDSIELFTSIGFDCLRLTSIDIRLTSIHLFNHFIYLASTFITKETNEQDRENDDVENGKSKDRNTSQYLKNRLRYDINRIRIRIRLKYFIDETFRHENFVVISVSQFLGQLHFVAFWFRCPGKNKNFVAFWLGGAFLSWYFS